MLYEVITVNIGVDGIYFNLLENDQGHNLFVDALESATRGIFSS